MAKGAALITGGTGFLGREVVKAFEAAGWTAVGTGFTRAAPPKILKCDLTDGAQVEKTLDEVKPEVVIHCAAERFPDRVEKDPAAARSLNVAATERLAGLCASRNALLVYISTDYVFPGVPGEAPYAATAAPRPTNLYGQTKLDGEHAVLSASTESGLGVVLRVPVLYGPVEPEGNNAESAVNVLLDAVTKAASSDESQSKPVTMDDWSLRYPTATNDIGRVLVQIADKYLAARSEGRQGDMPKILQFTGTQRFTKYEICTMLAEIQGLDISRMRADKEGGGDGGGVQRPYDCHLDMAELKEIGVDTVSQDFKAWWRWHLRAVRR